MITIWFLIGNLTAGVSLIVYALHWGLVTSVRQIQSKFVIDVSRTVPVKHEYKNSATMPFIFLPSKRLRRAPLESISKLAFVIAAFVYEFYLGFYYMIDENGHKKIKFKILNAQNLTIYTVFGLAAIVELLVHYRINMPNRLDHLMSVLAFLVEWILIPIRMRETTTLSVHSYALLDYAAFACFWFTALEVIWRNRVVITYGRILATLVQGTWLCHVGFLLYPQFITELTSYSSDLLNFYFCWHLVVNVIILILEFLLVNAVYMHCDRFKTRFDDLIAIDRDVCLDDLCILNRSYRKNHNNDSDDDEVKSDLIR